MISVIPKPFHIEELPGRLKATVTTRLSTDPAVGTEAVKLAANTCAGIIYGEQTLHQLRREDDCAVHAAFGLSGK